ncbi:MAG: hypothetical protein QXQ14_00250 [Candidatus Aenigmatarchaeota archaeon]
MKSLLQFSVLTLILLLSFSTFHELGHAFFATLNKCKATSIIFEEKINTYTIVKCNENFSILILFGGLIFTLFLSLLLLSFGKSYFILSLALSILLAADDLSIFINPTLIYIFSLFLISFSFKEFNKKRI